MAATTRTGKAFVSARCNEMISSSCSGPLTLSRGRLTNTANFRSQLGFTLLGVLIVIAILGLGLAKAGQTWQAASQREKEAELLFVGDQYRKAIESYMNSGGGVAAVPPKTFNELLKDPRFPNTVRHLRRVYRDPMTGQTNWGVVKDLSGGILGVYSLAEGVPFKTANFPPEYEDFESAGSYQDWVFEFVPNRDAVPGTVPGQATPAPNPLPLISK